MLEIVAEVAAEAAAQTFPWTSGQQLTEAARRFNAEIGGAVNRTSIDNFLRRRREQAAATAPVIARDISPAPAAPRSDESSRFTAQPRTPTVDIPVDVTPPEPASVTHGGVRLEYVPPPKPAPRAEPASPARCFDFGGEDEDESPVLSDSRPGAPHPAMPRFENPPGVSKSDQAPLPDGLAAPSGLPRMREMYWSRGYSEVHDLKPSPSGCAVLFFDTHVPYQNKRHVEVGLRLMEDVRPEFFIDAGDMFDFYELSDFEKDPSVFARSLQGEFDDGRYIFQAADRFAGRIVKLQGNHEDRMARTLFKNPGLWGLRALQLEACAELPIKTEVFPYLSMLRIGPFHVHHGADGGKAFGAPQYLAAAKWRKYGLDMAFGHHHRNDLFAVKHGGKVRRVWGVGSMADYSQLKYCNHPNWTESLGLLHWDTVNGEIVYDFEAPVFQNGAARINGRWYKG